MDLEHTHDPSVANQSGRITPMESGHFRNLGKKVLPKAHVLHRRLHGVAHHSSLF